ncbi:DinB family protein [Mycobacterium sp. smrl_JER01]|uniref:DinB family protein n=1 Tax=Mycobacterium sp. smrl_JER01 TaxID=3402633 RepID=UPI003AC5A0C9
MSNELTTQLAEQLDFHWTHQLRPRLDGLTDEEYFFEPVPHCWTVRSDSPRPFPDFAFPPPDPEPFTTIAWRMAHVIVGVLAVRTHSHFGGPPADYQSWDYAAGADAALRQLDDAYAAWITGVRALTDADLAKPCGPAEGAWADAPMTTLILHINREVIHHGAEISMLRDLFAHTDTGTHPGTHPEKKEN